MADASNQPVSTPAPETPESKILEMASAVISGEVFSREVTDVIEFRKSFGTFLDGLKAVATRFDEQLVQLRQIQGADFMEGVDHFRKPRTDKKAANSLLDSLKL